MSIRTGRANTELTKILSSQDETYADLISYEWEVEQLEIKQKAVNTVKNTAEHPKRKTQDRLNNDDWCWAEEGLKESESIYKHYKKYK